MPNPNFNYRGLPNYGYPNRNENIGLLIGTLLGAGLGAAGGENTADALLRGGAGGIASYGSGLRGIQDYNTDAFKQQTIADNLLYQPEEQERARGMYDMAKDKFDWEKMRDVNVIDPYMSAMTRRLLEKPIEDTVPGLGPINLHKAIQLMTPEEQKAFWETQSKMGYN